MSARAPVQITTELSMNLECRAGMERIRRSSNHFPRHSRTGRPRCARATGLDAWYRLGEKGQHPPGATCVLIRPEVGRHTLLRNQAAALLFCYTTRLLTYGRINKNASESRFGDAIAPALARRFKIWPPTGWCRARKTCVSPATRAPGRPGQNCRVTLGRALQAIAGPLSFMKSAVICEPRALVQARESFLLRPD
jgi:hypothetical protein